MDHQIGIAPDRTREVKIVCFGQTVMAERLRGVTRPLQALEQANLERLFFRFAADRSKKPLYLFTIRKIAYFVTETQNKLSVFAKLVRVRILVNAVNCGERSMPQLTRDRFVRREHEFFDELMRFVVLDSLQPDGLAIGVDVNFDFREIEIERAVLETFTTQQRSEFPGSVQPTAE